MGKKIRSTIIVDSDVWKEVRIEAIRRDMEMGQLVEEALRKELMRSLDKRRLKIEAFTEKKDVLPVDVDEKTFEKTKNQGWEELPDELYTNQNIINLGEGQRRNIKYTKIGYPLSTEILKNYQDKIINKRVILLTDEVYTGPVHGIWGSLLMVSGNQRTERGSYPLYPIPKHVFKYFDKEYIYAPISTSQFEKYARSSAIRLEEEDLERQSQRLRSLKTDYEKYYPPLSKSKTPDISSSNEDVEIK